MFVENRIVLPGQQPPIYVEQLDQFVPMQEALRQQQIRYASVYIGLVFNLDVPLSTELWKRADLEKSKLFDIMEQVRIKLNKKSKGQHKSLDLRSCKWEEVMSEVQETSQRWKTMPNVTAKAQKCLEILGQNSEAFQAWLGLLPAGDYGSR